MPITVFSQNKGGIDISSSPLSVPDSDATGQSYNYEYSKTGAITKVLGFRQINSVADSQLNTLGLGIHHSVSTDARTVVRAAGTKIQTVNPTTGGCTNIPDDTSSAATDFFSATATQPVVFSPFNTLTGGTQLWMAGAGLGNLLGFNGTQITSNGVKVPTGNLNLTVNTHDTGVWPSGGNGSYFYGVQFRKKSTQVLGNVSLDATATIVNLDDTVTIDLTQVSNIDTTLYDQIILWRSAISGVSGFTTGAVIAQLTPGTTSYVDTGTFITNAQNTPRSGNLVLDNSVLPSGTVNYVGTFKRRLVTAINSTLYLSDLNKPESWPASNVITLPTGGPITAIGTIGVPSEYTTGSDEYFVIFKERELWVLTGSSISDWSLQLIDKTGCEAQSLVVPFNGYLSWIGLTGIYLWEGRGRPMRISRPIYALFSEDGDLDLSRLSLGYGCYYELKNQVVWRLSHRTKGVNSFSIKLDIRLTIPVIGGDLESNEMDGVFIFDFDGNPYYGLTSYRAANASEALLAGDHTGKIYQLYNSSATAVAFDYETKPFDMGRPETLKQFKRVIVWIEKLTQNDLVLYFWADYRIRAEYQSSVKATMAPSKGTQPALWDVALFDQAYWDDYTPDISQIEFNLHSQENNAIGTSLKLKFEQMEASAPVRIHSFAIEWDEIGNLPLPTGQVA